MTIETGITPLLARLFAEELVHLQKRRHPIQQLPRSVPDLILAYLNALNRNRTDDDPDDPTLHRAAMIAAWECVGATFRPGQPGSKEAIRNSLVDAGIDAGLLDRMEKLGIVRTVEPAKTQVRFDLDPLSEYLAALKLLDDNSNSPALWHAFLATGDGKDGAPNSIKGFLTAVRDCCNARSATLRLPDFLHPGIACRLALVGRREDARPSAPTSTAAAI